MKLRQGSHGQPLNRPYRIHTNVCKSVDTASWNPSGSAYQVWSGRISLRLNNHVLGYTLMGSSYFSSAKDRISNRTVAVKKLAEPFKSDVVAQHMFREIKLLKELKHDNVRQSASSSKALKLINRLSSFTSMTSSSLRAKICMYTSENSLTAIANLIKVIS